jgi:hypothetical protein
MHSYAHFAASRMADYTLMSNDFFTHHTYQGGADQRAERDTRFGTSHYSPP